MERNKPKKSIISTGTTSIVLIFVMLSMLTFSVLSLTTAQANLRLSRLSAERTTAYYEAENAANDILIRIGDALDAAGQRSMTAGDFYTQARHALEGTDGITFTDDSHLGYHVPLGKHQFLAVDLALTYETAGPDRHYSITAWQAVSEYDWNPDSSLHLGVPIF